MNGDTMHRIPARDVIVHEPSEDCACGPRAELVQRPGKTDLWIHHHHALAITPNAKQEEGKSC